MVFESSPSTIPKIVLAMQPDPHSYPDPEFGSASSSRAEQGKAPTSTRWHDPAQQHEGDVNIPSPFHSMSPQSSSQTIDVVAAPDPLLKLNAGHGPSNVPYYINDDERHPSSASSITECNSRPTSKKQNQRRSFPPPITNDKLISPNCIPQTASTSYSKNRFVFSFIHKLKPLNPALVLQNNGSVARDHLASERTFLAYVRTSLGLAVAGVGIVQLSTIAELTSKTAGISAEVDRRVKVLAMPLGIPFVPGSFRLKSWGLIILLVYSFSSLFRSLLYDEVDSMIPQGVYRYYAIQRALLKNMFPSATWCIMFISFLLGAFLFVTFGALLYEKMGAW